MTPEKGNRTRNKSPVKRPHSAPGGAGPHKRKKTDPPRGEPVAKVLFAAGTDPLRDLLNPKDLEDPRKDPAGHPGGPQVEEIQLQNHHQSHQRP